MSIRPVKKIIQAQPHIEGAGVLNIRMDSESLFTLAYYGEVRNDQLRPSNKCMMKRISILHEPKFYDLRGNQLSFDFEKISDRVGDYTIHFPGPVEPGADFRYVLVSKLSDKIRVWKEDSLWHVRLMMNGPNRLNYCRLILPESAVFVDSTRDVTIIDNVDGRVAVTCRAHSGPMGDGAFHTAFLWPEKDRTTLADLPARYRGLGDSIDPEIVEIGRLEMARILTGKSYHDLSTPVDTMLTLYSALTRASKADFIKAIEPQLRELAAEHFDIEQMGQYVGYVDEAVGIMNIPQWPEKAQQGHKYSVDLSHGGSLLQEARLDMVYQDGNWYISGFQSGPVIPDKSDAGGTTSGGITISPADSGLAGATYNGLEGGKFMRKWLFLGPIDVPWKGEGYFPDEKACKAFFDTDSLDTQQFQPKVSITGIEHTWQNLESDYGVIDLTTQFDKWYSVAYAWARIEMPEETTGTLGIGSDDSVKVFLNGRLVHRYWEKNGRSVQPDNDRVAVTFKKGTNHLVLKIQNAGGPWGFTCRLMDESAGN